MPTTPQQRGLMVSAEGITGSGRTYLIQHMLAEHKALKARAVETGARVRWQEESANQTATL